ncbi:hypothetical protein MRX96_040387, partial [Rhipicephalus microplus]
MKNRPLSMQDFGDDMAVPQDEDDWLRTTVFCSLCLLTLMSCCIVLALFILYNEKSEDHEDATIRFLRVPEVSVRVQSLPPSTGVTKTEQPASRVPAIVPTQTEVILDPVCTTTQCHIESQWLRAKLDSTVDPCQDFYRYVCGSFRGTNQYIETEDLVEWMISLNLDLCNDTRLSTVDAVDMIVRCNLDFGLEVIFSITFHPIFFVGKMPAAHLGYSQADTAWWFWRGTVSKEHRSGVYIQLLRLYGVTSPRDELLAGKIMKYEKELQRIIKRTTPEEDPFQYGTIESMGELTKPYVTSSKWSTMFMTYTNLIYKGNSTIAYQEHVLKVLVKLLKYKAVGNDGLRHLIAWSLLRQLARYTKPESTADQNVNHLCYARVLMVMKMAVISPHLRM